MNKILTRHTSRGRLLGWLFALVAGATLVLSACAGGGSARNAPLPISRTAAGTTPTAPPPPLAFAQVTITERHDHFAFSPASLTIKAGTQVTWTNRGDMAHTVTSDTQAFTGSGAFPEHQTFSLVFWKPGTYAYHCSIHPAMQARIIVTP